MAARAARRVVGTGAVSQAAVDAAFATPAALQARVDAADHVSAFAPPPFTTTTTTTTTATLAPAQPAPTQPSGATSTMSHVQRIFGIPPSATLLAPAPPTAVPADDDDGGWVDVQRDSMLGRYIIQHWTRCRAPDDNARPWVSPRDRACVCVRGATRDRAMALQMAETEARTPPLIGAARWSDYAVATEMERRIVERATAAIRAPAWRGYEGETKRVWIHGSVAAVLRSQWSTLRCARDPLLFGQLPRSGSNLYVSPSTFLRAVALQEREGEPRIEGIQPEGIDTRVDVRHWDFDIEYHDAGASDGVDGDDDDGDGCLDVSITGNMANELRARWATVRGPTDPAHFDDLPRGDLVDWVSVPRSAYVRTCAAMRPPRASSERAREPLSLPRYSPPTIPPRRQSPPPPPRAAAAAAAVTTTLDERHDVDAAEGSPACCVCQVHARCVVRVYCVSGRCAPAHTIHIQ